LAAFSHFQVTNSLVALAQILVAREDFEGIYGLGAVLERTWNVDRAAHQRCCHRALRQLLPPASIERVIELFLARRDDSAWVRVATALMRWTDTVGVEKAFSLLEVESNPKNRIALIRLLSGTGKAGIEIIRYKLKDERWYVARNACLVLGELKDPEFAVQVAPLLHHADERVQQAAVAMLIRNRTEGRARIMAEALPHLYPSVLEQVLDELIVLQDPEVIPSIQQLAAERGGGKEIARKAAQVLAATGGDKAWEALGHILTDPAQDITVRKVALAALSVATSDHGRAWISQAARGNPGDPIASECERVRRESEPSGG
jgi:HEAT repeat protein